MKNFHAILAVLVIGATLLLIPHLASATTPLWVGGEDSDFTSTSAFQYDQTAGRFRSGYARGALERTGTVANATYYAATNVTSQTSLWAHGQIWLQTGSGLGSACVANATFGPEYLIGLTDATGVLRLVVSYYDPGCSSSGLPFPLTPFTGGELVMDKVTAAGAATTIGSSFQGAFNPSPAAPDTFDWQVSSYGASCTINFYINTALVFTFTGDCHTDSNTTLNGVRLYAPDITSHIADFSEIILANGDTRALGLVTMQPTGNGNTQAWTCTGGTNFGSVNAWSNTDSTDCNSGTGGQLEEFSVGTSLPGNALGILGVAEAARVAVGTTGPQNLQFDVRTGGTSYQSSNVSPAPGGSFGQSEYIWTTNPNTSTAWTTGNLTTAGFNIGLDSQN